MWADVIYIISVKIEFKSARVFGRYFLKTFPDTRGVNYLFRVYTVFYNNCFVAIVFNNVGCVVVY